MFLIKGYICRWVDGYFEQIEGVESEGSTGPNSGEDEGSGEEN